MCPSALQVTRNTGFAEGLYSDGETNAGAIKGKDAKIAYLNKVRASAARVALGNASERL